MEICRDNSSKDFQSASDLAERNRLWNARYNSWFAFKALYPNRRAISTDVCVPISQLPDVLVQTNKDIEELKLKSAIVGHVGDGNFHTFLSLDVNDTKGMDSYSEYNKRLIGHALKAEGTCTGEHGIAIGL